MIRGTDAYYSEVYERYVRGEFVHEDSIVSLDTTLYKTLVKGRRVYGGGGIRPDVFVPMDTSADNEYFFAVRSFVPEFIYKYSSDHPQFMEKYKTMEEFNNGFAVSQQMLDEFYGYAITAGLKEQKARNPRIAERVKLNLKAFLAKQVWRMDGYYFVTNQDDNVIKTALQTLSKEQ